MSKADLKDIILGLCDTIHPYKAKLLFNQLFVLKDYQVELKFELKFVKCAPDIQPDAGKQTAPSQEASDPKFHFVTRQSALSQLAERCAVPGRIKSVSGVSRDL